jgi:hypothetical protein
MPLYCCPNRDCAFNKILKKGEFCPNCGQEAQSFEAIEAMKLLTIKNRLPRSRPNQKK